MKIDNIELGQRVTRRSQWPKEYGEEDIHPEAGKIGKVVAYTDGNKKKYGASNSFINGQLQWELLVIVEYDGGE